MSLDESPPSTREQAIAALAQLVGLPVTAARRAADMRTLQFGTLRAVEGGSVGDLALHIQCPWRVDGPSGIVTGWADLWEPHDQEPGLDWDAWSYEKSPNLQDARLHDLMNQRDSSLVVESIDADEYGGAVIVVSGGYAIRLFPAGSTREDWRLFRPTMNQPHFVVSGGKAEVGGKPA